MRPHRHLPWFCRAAIFAIVVAAISPAGADDELTAESCLTCHANADFVGPDNRPLSVNAASFAASPHGALGCNTCHSDATAIPHEPKLKQVGLETCAACHADAVAAYQQSVHGQAREQGKKDAAACIDCHGNIHSIVPSAKPTSPVHWSHLAATCAHCHANGELVEKAGIPVVRPVEAYLASAHAAAVNNGKHGATCSDCHGAHSIFKPGDPRSSLWRANVAESCAKCHGEIGASYRDSVHGVAVSRGIKEAPTCTDCHGEHRILGPSEPTSPVFAANIPGETCGRCHSNERLSEKFGLKVGKVSAFQDSFHGLALKAGRVSVANCGSCHGVHDIRPSKDPRSHVNAANLSTTCGKCHPGAGEKFALGPVHGTPESTANVAVGWIGFIYVWVIVLTIGGMAVHNGLDWLRKARHPEPPPPPVPAGQPPRMTRVMRWQHATMMTSFPVLVYTGFALTYPEAWWAVPLLRWEQDLGLRGLVHRCAAVVMLLGLGWHMIHLAVSAPARACLKAILPRPRDLSVVFGTFAYYLGWRDEKPRSGQFNYAEKAEYWAFLWGSTLMTLTGFLLWFENLTLRYLPSWAADVATALHFYEAVLATLSILVWHFYWVIFDPDVYPMDWTWWNGRPPASRVHEREEEEASSEHPK